MRILIAEDEKSLNRILVKQFTKLGYSVDSCFDGESVALYITNADYDVITSVVISPEDAIQIAQEILNFYKGGSK